MIDNMKLFNKCQTKHCFNSTFIRQTICHLPPKLSSLYAKSIFVPSP